MDGFSLFPVPFHPSFWRAGYSSLISARNLGRQKKSPVLDLNFRVEKRSARLKFHDIKSSSEPRIEYFNSSINYFAVFNTSPANGRKSDRISIAEKKATALSILDSSPGAIGRLALVLRRTGPAGPGVPRVLHPVDHRGHYGVVQYLRLRAGTSL